MMTCLVVLLAVGVVQAEEQAERARNWGFGWDDGLTVRRQLGAWQLGLAAGPNDHLSDASTQRFHPDFPDSIQGIIYDSDQDRRESGSVRLQLGRELASQKTLVFGGQVACGYSWSDESYNRTYYYPSTQDWELSRDSSFRETWVLSLGARLAWYPLPFLSLETKFGLQYRWVEYERDDWDRRPGETEWSLRRLDEHSHTFQSYGTDSVLYNLTIVVWL